MDDSRIMAEREIAAGLVTIELLARMILGARGPVLIGLTSAEPPGILERATGEGPAILGRMQEAGRIPLRGRPPAG